MDTASLQIKVDQAGDLVRVTLAGELDKLTIRHLHRGMQEARAGHGDVEVDVSELRRVDALGVQALTREADALRTSRRFMVLTNTPVLLRALLQQLFAEDYLRAS
jgi:anti-anti-sigma factor